MTSTEEVLSLAEELLVEWAWEAEGVRPESNRLDVMVASAEDLVAMVTALRVRLPRERAVVDTLSEIIPSAEPFERELSEMFGITIKGLRAPKHIYLPDEWPEGAYPLRKDFDREVLSSQG
jgi:Ni,Fe-hydrogenase III component G